MQLLRRLRQKKCRLNSNLDYKASSSLKNIEKSFLKIKKKKRKEGRVKGKKGERKYKQCQLKHLKLRVIAF